MVYGYFRVTAVNKNRIERLQKEYEELMYSLDADAICYDVADGSKSDRPKLMELVEKLGNEDSLLIPSLVHIAYSVREALELIECHRR